MPATLPRMSHRAMSTPAIASNSMPPERPDRARRIVRQSAAISVGLPPDEARLQRGLDQFRIGLGRKARQRLADAGDAGIGAHLDEARSRRGIRRPTR